MPFIACQVFLCLEYRFEKHNLIPSENCSCLLLFLLPLLLLLLILALFSMLILMLIIFRDRQNVVDTEWYSLALIFVGLDDTCWQFIVHLFGIYSTMICGGDKIKLTGLVGSI